jgi:GTP-binding protein HflX
MEVVDKTLKDISASDKPIYVIFNKIDAYEAEPYDQFSMTPRTEKNFSLDEVKSKWRERNIPCIFISATEKKGIDKLKDDLYKMVAEIHAGRYPFNNFLW